MVFSPFALPTLTSGILFLIFIFIFITTISLIIILKSNISWLVKLSLIIISVVVYVAVYQGMMQFSGWPSVEVLPKKFQIHWTFIREPDKFSKKKGAIYMWIEELDEQNIPFGTPRSYELPYTPPLEEEVLGVQGNLELGIEQAATVERLTQDKIDLYNEKNREATTTKKVGDSGGYQTFESLDGVYQITFGDLPELELPEKSPF